MPQLRHSIVGAFLLTSMLAACGPNVRDDGGGGTGVDAGGGAEPDAALAPAGRCQAMDIMFIVDDSGSMEQEQGNLATNFPMFADVLSSYEVEPGRPLDYRVAVTTTGRTVSYSISSGPITLPMTETGRNGAFVDGAGSTRRWLERSDVNMASMFAQRARVGITGPGFEMALLMTQMALRERVTDGTNAGFLRDDALLAVVMITDENDCSRTDNNWMISPAADPCTGTGAPFVAPAETIAFLDQVKGGRGRWSTAVIAGQTDCTSTFGDAAEATKLIDFVNQVNSGAPAGRQNAVFSSICEGNLAPALQQALDTFQAACENFPPVE